LRQYDILVTGELGIPHGFGCLDREARPLSKAHGIIEIGGLCPDLKCWIEIALD
jgi:hypothetical protein